MSLRSSLAQFDNRIRPSKLTVSIFSKIIQVLFENILDSDQLTFDETTYQLIRITSFPSVTTNLFGISVTPINNLLWCSKCIHGHLVCMLSTFACFLYSLMIFAKGTLSKKSFKNSMILLHQCFSLTQFGSRSGPGLQLRVCIGKLFSLFLIQNICCGYSKESSQ